MPSANIIRRLAHDKRRTQAKEWDGEVVTCYCMPRVAKKKKKKRVEVIGEEEKEKEDM